MSRGWLLVIACACACKGVPPGEGATPPAADDPAYIRWLEERSMLAQAALAADRLDGEGEQWRHPFSQPQSAALVKEHSVWLLHYPGSVITKPGVSVIATWADPELWDYFQSIGIDLLHTCPTKRAGGVVGTTYTPTIDGWFDRISSEIDPQLGTEAEYRRMVEVARLHGGAIAGDIVPLHTGMGPDFRLAQRRYKDYDGLYTMVEIDPKDWSMLPAVEGPWATALVTKEVAIRLEQAGYIPGLITSADPHPEARTWSGWSATGEILGYDGRTRRWVYLHVFKPGQPTLNWSDPSYAARRMVVGDVVHSLRLGDEVMRLDAVPFLGIEPRPGQSTSWFYMNPLSVLGTNDLAFLIRKLGGRSFQELNVPLEQYKLFATNGPDLGYDFFTRAQTLSPLLEGDARPLRFAHQLLLAHDVQPGTLIHDLQNHDEITFQMPDLAIRKQPVYRVDDRRISGERLRQELLDQMRAKVAGEAAPYNKLYRAEQDGVATTFAGFIAPAIGIRDPYHATPAEVARIQRAHLLVAHANAMQPGVFALASWDLVGALPIPEEGVKERVAEGDYRWINRGGVDLLGDNPDAERSAFGIPRAQALYGSLRVQMATPNSFASQLKKMLAARKAYRIAEGRLIAVPDVDDRAVCVLVMTIPSGALAITALNYKPSATVVMLDLAAIPGVASTDIHNKAARDIVASRDVGEVSSTGYLSFRIDGYAGRTVVLQ